VQVAGCERRGKVRFVIVVWWQVQLRHQPSAHKGFRRQSGSLLVAERLLSPWHQPCRPHPLRGSQMSALAKSRALVESACQGRQSVVEPSLHWRKQRAATAA
jgi:hypothetical protein